MTAPYQSAGNGCIMSYDHVSAGFAALQFDCAASLRQVRNKMRLFGIEDERLGYELWPFECLKCHHIQTKIGKAAA